MLFIDKLIEQFPKIERVVVPIQQIVPLMMPGGPLADLLPEMPRTVNGLNVTLGRYIKSVNGRVFGSHRLSSKTGAGNKSSVWCPKIEP